MRIETNLIHSENMRNAIKIMFEYHLNDYLLIYNLTITYRLLFFPCNLPQIPKVRSRIDL